MTGGWEALRRKKKFLGERERGRVSNSFMAKGKKGMDGRMTLVKWRRGGVSFPLKGRVLQTRTRVANYSGGQYAKSFA